MRYSLSVKFNKDFVEVDEQAKRITIGVRARPVKGKANEGVVKKLAERFGVPSSSVRIVAGAKSKNKIVEIL
jgi:hypothetical protein